MQTQSQTPALRPKASLANFPRELHLEIAKHLNVRDHIMVSSVHPNMRYVYMYHLVRKVAVRAWDQMVIRLQVDGDFSFTHSLMRTSLRTNDQYLIAAITYTFDKESLSNRSERMEISQYRRRLYSLIQYLSLLPALIPYIKSMDHVDVGILTDLQYLALAGRCPAAKTSSQVMSIVLSVHGILGEKSALYCPSSALFALFYRSPWDDMDIFREVVKYQSNGQQWKEDILPFMSAVNKAHRGFCVFCRTLYLGYHFLNHKALGLRVDEMFNMGVNLGPLVHQPSDYACEKCLIPLTSAMEKYAEEYRRPLPSPE